jgi:DNA helicase II / ATP-dependent DNA helicase PcrA
MESLLDIDPLAGLNPAQREAVIHFEGPLLVLAGAGSGKTRVLTTRIARLVQHHGVDPSRILAVTFTNKAATEMRARLTRLLAAEPTGMWVGTFHAIGARLLRSYAPLVGRDRNFTIYDESDTLGIVKRIMDRHRISPREWTPKSIAAQISDAKNALVAPEEYRSMAFDPLRRAAAAVYDDLERDLRATNAVTFDDLLTLPVEILRAHAEVRERLQERFQFVLVDEYQDTNRAQFEFIRLLGGHHGNVAVVGDDDQSIYGWRGADIRNILDFEKHFPAARVVRLEENYRSTPNILEVANVAIRDNIGRKGKTLRATRPGGERVTVVATLDERDEAEWISGEITARRSTEGLRLHDVAILYRTNAQSRPFEEIFRREGIPYRLVGAVRFYDRREIRDLMSYLKLIANPSDDEAFRRAISVPKRGLGDTTVEMLGEIGRAAKVSLLEAAGRPEILAAIRPAARSGLRDFHALIAAFRARAEEASVDELLEQLIETIRYADYLRAEGPELARERGENVSELIASAAETVVDEGGEVGLRPLDHFLQRAMLIAGVDQLDSNADAVTLMTIHNAKGLEFPYVFVTGLEDGLFPLAQSIDQPETLEEERRLFYVGITRAERKLYFTHAKMRRRNGEMLPSMPSRFLKSIPPALLDDRRTLAMQTSGRHVWADDRPTRSHMSRTTHDVPSWKKIRFTPEEESREEATYAAGERVKHKLFGSGTITEVSGSGRDVKAVIDFDDSAVGRKTIKLAYTTLERGSR